jgi:hypothetical protein
MLTVAARRFAATKIKRLGNTLQSSDQACAHA